MSFRTAFAAHHPFGLSFFRRTSNFGIDAAPSRGSIWRATARAWIADLQVYPDAARRTVAVRGRVTGLLARDGGEWRLSWFAGSDPRLVAYAGPLDGDVEALAEALGRRIGGQVELDSLQV